jgi:glycosyltransferase involved in cell wall biosynthesis
MSMPKKIFIVAINAWFINNFRLSLMKALREKGHSVTAVAIPDEYVSRIEENGFPFIPVAISRKGMNPVEDLALVYRFYQLFKNHRPDVILTFTPKPNIYASIAARLNNMPVINSIEGLGYVFINPSFITTIVKYLYKFALYKSDKVFFLNNDDLKLFLDSGLVKQSITERMPGAGIDTRKFVPQPGQRTGNSFTFLLVARILWDKGVGEFVEAARVMKTHYPHVEFRIVGFVDQDNPQGISNRQVQAWVDEGVISYDGPSDDIAGIMGSVECVVLPSYREGLSRVLLEAASMAIPIITTDTTGCRDVVDDGVTGYLCRIKDTLDLADKMELILLLPEEERKLMGQKGREKILREFDERIVIQRYIEVIEGL